MPVVSLKETLDHAFAGRYGVPAINIIDDLSISAVLAAAFQERSPVILQTSVKTVKMYGRDQLFGVFSALVRDIDVPVSLHLDHCPDREWISICLEGRLELGPVRRLQLDVAENTPPDDRGRRRGRALRRPGRGRDRERARRRGRGRLRRGRRCALPSRSPRGSSRSTGVYSLRAGDRHRARPVQALPRAQARARHRDSSSCTRSRWSCTAAPGLTEAQFTDLIARGCAKVNISTALKIAFVERTASTSDANPGKHDPAVDASATSEPRSSRWPSTTSGCSDRRTRRASVGS